MRTDKVMLPMWAVVLSTITANLAILALTTLIAGLAIFAIAGVTYTWKAFAISYIIVLLFKTDVPIKVKIRR